MKHYISFVCSLVIGIGSVAAAAPHDFLASETLQLRGPETSRALQATVDNVRDVFEKYEPKLDSSTKIKRPLVVGGSRSAPRMQMTVEKCIGFVCRTVELDFVVVIHERRGNCSMNFVMDGDLSRSNDLLTEIYDRLHVDICYRSSNNGGTLELSASARRAPSYKQDILQRELFKMLRMQVNPIVRAINATLRENGAQSNRRILE